MFGERGIEIVAGFLQSSAAADTHQLIVPALETLQQLCYSDENRAVIRSSFGIADVLLVLKSSPNMVLQELAIRLSDLLM